MAEEIGVFAEPEILIWPIGPKDRFAIIASDGVFEFLTSQAVVDMVVKHATPLEAAKYIVAEAYRLWLTYDERTDDITIIIITFDGVKVTNVVDSKALKDDSFRPSISPRNISPRAATNIEALRNRPVRRIMAANRRRLIAAEDTVNLGAASTFVPKEYPKVSILLVQ